jgi:hypothetical protein
MNDTIVESDPSEDEILLRDVPDAALEAAAGTDPACARSFTVYMCTVMADCSS